MVVARYGRSHTVVTMFDHHGLVAVHADVTGMAVGRWRGQPGATTWMRSRRIAAGTHDTAMGRRGSHV